MSVTTAAPAARATRRDWIGLAAIALPCVVVSMDLTVLNLALPHVSADLQPGAAQLLWIIDIYGFLVAGCLITMGTLGDRIGRRRLLLIGAAAFAVASVLAAFAPSAELLIAARALLGIAGATLAPSTLSLIRNMFHDPRERTAAVGVWIMSFSVGGAIGPLVGGLLLEHFWWGSVFLLGAPVMAMLLVLGPLLLPEFHDPGAGRLDILSAALSLVAVLTVIYGLKRLAEGGLSWPAAAAIAAGIAVGVAFVRRQRALADPLIDLRLFRSRAFATALATNLIGLMMIFGSFLFMAQYMQLVLGMSPLEAGLWTLPSSFGFIAGSVATPRIVRHVAKPALLVAGLLLGMLGYALFALVGGPSGFTAMIVGSALMALGLTPVLTLATDVVVGAAPPERAGAAAAISETGAEFGGALGIAVLGSVGAAIYRSVMLDAVPAGVPAAAAAAARDTLGAAVDAAAALPAASGAALLAAARDAFTEGFIVIGAIGAAVLLATAAAAALLLRPR